MRLLLVVLIGLLALALAVLWWGAAETRAASRRARVNWGQWDASGY